MSRIGALILINDNNDPQTLALSAWFGSSNTVSEWTLTIQTADGVASTNQLGTTGGNAARFDFTGHPNIGIINNISAGTRFLFGPYPHGAGIPNGQPPLPQTSTARPSLRKAPVLQALQLRRRWAPLRSLSQPILSRHIHADTVAATARISEPVLSQQAPTATPDVQTVGSIGGIDRAYHYGP